MYHRAVKPYRADKAGIPAEQFQQRPGNPYPGNTDQILLAGTSLPSPYADIPDINGSEERRAHGSVFDLPVENFPGLEDKIVPQGLRPLPYDPVDRVKAKGAEDYEEGENHDMQNGMVFGGTGIYNVNPVFFPGFSKIFQKNPHISILDRIAPALNLKQI
jgi:hypothetical protein